MGCNKSGHLPNFKRGTAHLGQVRAEITTIVKDCTHIVNKKSRNRTLNCFFLLGHCTVILKLTLRHKTDSTDRAAADCADFTSASRFRSFCRFYVSLFPNLPVMLIVLDH